MEPAYRISGTALVEQVLAQARQHASSTTRYLAGFVASDDAAGLSFQKAKQRAAGTIGCRYTITQWSPSISQDAAASALRATLADPECGGVVIQLPLPVHLDTQALLDCVPPSHDPDLLSITARTLYTSGLLPIHPPAARATEIILEHVGVSLEGKNIILLGMGRLIGQPIIDWLHLSGHTFTVCDIGFDESLLSDADLIIAGTGAYSLDPSRLKPGAGVVDFGYRKEAGVLTGDLDTRDMRSLEHLAFYTPTPGGTGPILIAALLENFLTLQRQAA